MYWVSPVAETICAYSEIVAEWVDDAKQEKVYLPEPPFPHSQLIQTKKLFCYRSIKAGNLFSILQTPCIVFAGHPSLRFGDGVHLVNYLKSDARNCIILTDTQYDPVQTLMPFEPISCDIHRYPIDMRLNYQQSAQILKDIKPKRVILPKREQGYLQVQYDGALHEYGHLSTLSIPISQKYASCQITPAVRIRILFAACIISYIGYSQNITMSANLFFDFM
mmetsp:Transcript_12475/g.13854  ORF Transcript_12475/g.13854 Transcript_12475/m.13854 type:complete len:221 (+) Transcript_12475:257-919(+)